MKKHKFKIPYYEQAETAECGLCCMAMVMSYYYCEYTINELREKYYIGRDGLNLLIIKHILEEKGFITQGFKVFKVSDLLFPAILSVNKMHFIVAEKRTANGIMVIDPQRGRYEMEEIDLVEKNISIGLQIKESPNSEKRYCKSKINNYQSIIEGTKKNIFLAMLCTFFLQILTLTIPILARVLVDNISVIKKFFRVESFTMLAVFIGVLYAVLYMVKGKVIVKLQVIFSQNISQKFVKKILQLPANFFANRGTGDLVHRYTGAVIVREMLSSRIISIWLDMGIIILYCIYMTTISCSFTGIMLLFASIMILIALFNIKKSKQLLTKEIMEEANATAFFNEIVRGINLIKMKGGEQHIYNLWNQFFEKQMTAMRKKGNFTAGMSSTIAAIQFAAPLVLLVLGINQVISEKMTIGIIFSVYIVSQSFYAPVNSIVSIFNEVLYANSYFSRLSEIYIMKEEENFNRDIKDISCTGKIVVENVGYKYNMYGKSILDNISLTIEAGEMVGIVGETGSGKSTLVTLLMGLVDVSSGKIFLDNKNVANIDRRVLRRQIGVVSQDGYFFKESIKKNIAFGEKDVSEEKIIEACKIAEIWDDIQKMPMGLETILSENAANISGGQKQRLALARAIINNPKILILDEATSALDNITERKIQKSLKEISCTRIVVAHRLETIIDADKIVVLKEGKIIGMGKHEELLKNNSYYSDLYQKRRNCI